MKESEVNESTVRNKNFTNIFLFASTVFLISTSCSRINEDDSQMVLFHSLSSDRTHIDFENSLKSTNDFNIYKYRNFYNGGGVGLGDVNNDGLLDIYFTANLLLNRLYLNKGNFVFEDVTEKAKVGGTRAWSTGVSMVDINGDGWLDIYVCNSGDVEGDNKQNEFFINNGDGTFTDKAEEMGLADTGFSTHAAFFDYDKDGDLDVYLLNNSYRSIGSFNPKENERLKRDKMGGDKLLRNDDGIFIDVSDRAGIYGSVIGFGLGVSVSDLDKDGWQDLYISNDFFERDYIYMNNGDGTFREELEKQMHSISHASMGSDVADLTGDGYPEIFVTEMLPEVEDRFKTTIQFDNWDRYHFNSQNGYHYQFTRNTLQRNNGPIPEKGTTFSEIGRMAGVEATDWSWSALITDLNNDGCKDIFIANGIAQDILNQDFLNYMAYEEVAKMVINKKGVDFKQLIDKIPVNKIPNYAYAGGPETIFTNKAKEWGLAEPSHSNGAAYGDLDNDGDMDLVVNNVNMAAFVYRNQSNAFGNDDHNFLKVILEGKLKNKAAIGTKVTLKADDRMFYQEQMPNRGFQSSVDNRLNFGVGSLKSIDTLIVEWYYGGRTTMTNVQVNQTLTLVENEADVITDLLSLTNPTRQFFNETTHLISLDYKHKENIFSDFDRDRLIYHMKSTEGPRIALGDVNNDGLEDFYIGGAKDSPGKLFVQLNNGKFKLTNQEIFEKDRESEDLGCLFLDVDGDGDQDLYVTSGGNEHSTNSFALMDRLYINDGKGVFIKSPQQLPSSKPESTSTVRASDFDNDGDQDLFVGVRLRPGLIGVPQNGYILRNDGKGNFKNITNEIAPELLGCGMISDAQWTDYDGDGDMDLMVVGEWMTIKLFENTNGIFKEVTHQAGLSNTSGWWNRLQAADLDGDGDIDFVVGNHGLNSRFRASKEEPITCYINDFDKNGTVEQIICSYNDDVSYPMVLRHDLVTQLPHLKKKYLTYESYKGQRIEDLFTQEELKSSVINKVTMLESVMLINDGSGKFNVKVLPQEAQLSPIYGILLSDIDHDGILDMVLGGNLYNVKPEIGRYDASHGVYLKGNGKGEFKSIPTKRSGLFLEGEIRDIQFVDLQGKRMLMVARNNDSIQFFEFEK